MPQSMLNQGETFDDLPFVAANSTFFPAGTAWSKGIQSSVSHGAPFSRWITTLAPAPMPTVASTALICSRTGLSWLPRFVK